MVFKNFLHRHPRSKPNSYLDLPHDPKNPRSKKKTRDQSVDRFLHHTQTTKPIHFFPKLSYPPKTMHSISLQIWPSSPNCIIMLWLRSRRRVSHVTWPLPHGPRNDYFFFRWKRGGLVLAPFIQHRAFPSNSSAVIQCGAQILVLLCCDVSCNQH